MRYRILILGLPGSGKTTLARSLSQRFNIRHIECDKYFHEANFLKLIAQEITQDNFVVEGHFKDLKNLFMQQEWTHVYWLDPHYPIITWRLLKREIIKKGLRQAFSSEGTLWFFLKNHRRLRAMQMKAFEHFQENRKIQTLRLKKGRL